MPVVCHLDLDNPSQSVLPQDNSDILRVRVYRVPDELDNASKEWAGEPG